MSDRNADLEVLGDALSAIRARPEVYIGQGDRGLHIAEAVLGDALLLGATRVLCERHGDWFVISADVDWLTVACRFPAPVAELFRRIVPLPEAGANSMRSEVLIAAFATSAVATTPSDEIVICGDPPPLPVAQRLRAPTVQRSVAFTLGSLGAQVPSEEQG